MPPTYTPLTPRQIEALTLAAQGLQAKQIAREMQISKYTTKQFLAQARERLGALNTTHAIALAIFLGEIDFKT